jgi:hypothetical protein
MHPLTSLKGKGMLDKIVFSEINRPEVCLNPTGFITIKGRSMGGNLNSFYSQINDWIEEYIINPADVTFVDVYLEYLKGYDLKIYISLLRKITSVRLNNKNCIINWYFEEGDEDMVELGECIAMILKLPFNMIEISDPSQFKVITS